MTIVRPDPVETGRPVVGQVDVVEEIVASAPLGLRFWDWALDQPVRDGLLVRARPAAGGEATTARASSSGVHGFLSLPTTRDEELGPMSDFDGRTAYTVSVVDRRGRFVPLGLTVDAPVAGVQPGPGTLTELDDGTATLPGFYLFSSATRVVPPGCVGVRIDLRDERQPIEGAAGQFAPAAHALVRVETDDDIWYGVADAQGRVLVVAPAPVFAAPAEGAQPLDPTSQSWSAALEVRYEALPAGGVTGVPDFADVADQAVARANHTSTTFTTSVAVDIEYGEVLVVRSPGRSDLLVRPA